MQRWDWISDRDETEQAGARIIGLGIRRARLATGISQRQLAWRCGLHQSTISRLESGRLRGMRFRTLSRILGVLRAPPTIVFPDEPPPPRRRLPGHS